MQPPLASACNRTSAHRWRRRTGGGARVATARHATGRTTGTNGRVGGWSSRTTDRVQMRGGARPSVGRWLSSRGWLSPSSVPMPSSSAACVSRGGGRCVAALGGDDAGDEPREKWRALCVRVEGELPAERRVLRRIVRWVGENPVAALVTAVATACTAGAVASALALQLAFSGLSIILPAVLFATVGASTFLFFGSVILFGFILPSAGFMAFATGGTILATLSAVAPVVCFAVAAVVGARMMDMFLPQAADPEDMVTSSGDKARRRSGGEGHEDRDPDLTAFDKRLYGNAVLWKPSRDLLC